MKMEFKDWSDQWKELREDAGNYKDVLKMWKTSPRDGLNREEWKGIFGYRKSGEVKGEKCIEYKFLNIGNEERKHLLVNNSRLPKKHLDIYGVAHNMALGTQRRGQVIPDCLGRVEDRRSVSHPLAVEVKITANDVWFAVVENLQQVRMLRANVGNVKQFFNDKDFKGAWGMVLAPHKYFYPTSKRDNRLQKALKLIEFMAEKTEARIILASADRLSESKIDYVGGYWPE